MSGSQQQAANDRVAPTNAVHVLWALSDHYLKCSAHVLKCPNRESAQRAFEQYLRAAVRCLEAVLAHPSMNQESDVAAGASKNPSLMPASTLAASTEIRTRAQLAQILISYTDNYEKAEDHLAKASLLAQQMNDLECRFRLRDLWCHLFYAAPGGSRIRQSKLALKTAAAEAAKAEAYSWYYHFMRRRATLHAKEGDWAASLVVLSEGAEQARKRSDVEMEAIFLLSLSQTALAAKDHQIAGKALDSLEARTAASLQDALPNPILNEVRTYYLLTRVIFEVQVGSHKRAIELLPELHSRLEGHNDSTVAPGSICMVPVGDKDRKQTISVPVRLLTRHRLFIMGFFASGVAHKADDLTKARKYLGGALKAIDMKPHRLEEALEARTWFSRMRLNVLIHSAETSIVTSEFQEAARILESLTESCASDAAEWAAFEDSITLLWGMLFQAAGTLERAEVWLTAVARQEKKEEKRLAMVNLALIYFKDNPDKASKSAGSPFNQILAWNFLGTFYIDTDPNLASKVFKHALKGGKKYQINHFASVSAAILAGMSLKLGEESEQKELEEISKVLRAKADKAREVIRNRFDSWVTSDR
ncbi:hypothetical protein HK097_011616 [Rhizophlyctis rosea]|uniref:Uncharacterized protein n=1 Tax=Rhizophlyctis rosea TaxID=64517 RepID=A0AAD5SJW9_9FUNG|nr:hypothetical protein HK097_011616 [Rhizophlyctis rosea]